MDDQLVVLDAFDDYQDALVAAARLRSAGLKAVIPNRVGSGNRVMHPVVPNLQGADYRYALLVRAGEEDLAAALLDDDTLPEAMRSPQVETWADDLAHNRSASAAQRAVGDRVFWVILAIMAGLIVATIAAIVLTT